MKMPQQIRFTDRDGLFVPGGAAARESEPMARRQQAMMMDLSV